MIFDQESDLGTGLVRYLGKFDSASSHIAIDSPDSATIPDFIARFSLLSGVSYCSQYDHRLPSHSVWVV